MKLLLSTCLLLTLLSPGSSANGTLLCTTPLSDPCKGIGMSSCNSTIEDQTCYFNLVEFPLEDVPEDFKFYSDYGCMAREDCLPDIYTASLVNEISLYVEVQCCEEDLCNLPIINKRNRELNGMKCIGFLEKEKKLCLKRSIVRCRGDEDHCIQYFGDLRIGNTTSGPMYFQGCATSNLCDTLMEVPGAENSPLMPIDKKEAHCSPAK